MRLNIWENIWVLQSGNTSTDRKITASSSIQWSSSGHIYLSVQDYRWLCLFGWRFWVWKSWWKPFWPPLSKPSVLLLSPQTAGFHIFPREEPKKSDVLDWKSSYFITKQIWIRKSTGSILLGIKNRSKIIRAHMKWKTFDEAVPGSFP